MEWKKKRVKRFLSLDGGLIEITTKIRFVEFHPVLGYEQKIPDKAFCRRLITTEMFKDIKNKKDIFDWEFKLIGDEFFKIFEKVITDEHPRENI